MGVNCGLDKLKITLLKPICWNKKNKMLPVLQTTITKIGHFISALWIYFLSLWILYFLLIVVEPVTYIDANIWMIYWLLPAVQVMGPFPLMLVDEGQNRNLIFWFHNCYHKDLHQDSSIKNHHHQKMAAFISRTLWLIFLFVWECVYKMSFLI